MKLNTLIFSVVVCFTQSIHCQEIDAKWTNHPLWVGYESTKQGRDPKLSGKIDNDFIAQFLSDDPIIVEAGCFDGSDTIKMSEKWPKATIYAFEPVPDVFKSLKEKIGNRSRVHLFAMALSDGTGVQPFFLSSGAEIGSSSLLPPDKAMVDNHSNIQFSQVIEVPVTTLDNWAEKNNIDHVDFLWLDLQGMEPVVLKASPKILKTVQVIFSEVSLESLYQGSVLYNEFKEWLVEQGFEVVREDIPWKDGGNALFVRKGAKVKMKPAQNLKN